METVVEDTNDADNQCKIGQSDFAREEQHKRQYDQEKEKDGAFGTHDLVRRY